MTFFNVLFQGLDKNPSFNGKVDSPQQLREIVCDNMCSYQSQILPGFGFSPIAYFNMFYGEHVQDRRCLSFLNHKSKSSVNGCFVNSFLEYATLMKDDDIQFDTLVFAFCAFILGLNLTVHTQSDVPDGSVTIHSYRGIEQASCPLFKICILLEGVNFKLIDQPDEVQPELSSESLCTLLSMGFPREKAEQALLAASGDVELAIQHLLSLRRVTLPDIPDEILEPEMAAIQLEQPSSPVELLTSIENFHDACNLKASSESLPESTSVNVLFNVVFLDAYRENLFGSMLLGERHDVKYRVVSFTMRNQSIVAYDGDIRNLSRKANKLAFYSQLYPEILHQDVISVRIERLN